MKLQRYITDSGARIALVAEPDRKYMRLVYIDTPVAVHKVPNDHARYMRDVLQGAGPIKTVARKMLKAGKRLGITKAARKFLNEVLL